MDRKGLFYIFLLVSAVQGGDISIVVEQNVGGCGEDCDGPLPEPETPPPPPTEDTCVGEGYVRIESSCYFFSPSWTYFWDAKDICVSKSMEFVRIEDAAEFTALKDIALMNDIEYWVGIENYYDPSTWVWTVDGTPAPYLQWASYYPRTGYYYSYWNCVSMNFGGIDMGNFDCYLYLGYICESA